MSDTINDVSQVIVEGVRKMNYRRRVRKLTVDDVCAVIAQALRGDLGYAYMTGGNVDANSYGYPCSCAAFAAVRFGDRVGLKFGSANAAKGHSPVTWFGPHSARLADMQAWLKLDWQRIHLSIWSNPTERGLIPYRVTFWRKESEPLRSMLEEGVLYRVPEHYVHAIVYAENTTAIPHILDYHYGRTWDRLMISSDNPD